MWEWKSKAAALLNHQPYSVSFSKTASLTLQVISILSDFPILRTGNEEVRRHRYQSEASKPHSRVSAAERYQSSSRERKTLRQRDEMPRQWQVWRSPSRLNEDFSVLQLRQDPRNPRHNGSKPNEGSHCVRDASHTDNMQHSCTPVLYSTLFPLVPSPQQHLSELCYRWLDVDLSRRWQLNDTCCTDCTFGFFVLFCSTGVKST